MAELNQDQLREFAEHLQEMNRIMPQTRSSFSGLSEGATGMEKGLLVAGKAASNLAGAFTSAMGAMYEGQKGLKAFDQSIDKTADALMVLTGALALIGGPITLLAAGLTAAVAAGAKYVKAANEQSDKLYDAFQQMSRSGGAAADGLQGLYNDVQKLGGGIQDLGDFVSLIASSSKDLATFGGSVFEGRREFARLGKEMEPFRAALMNSGMTQKEINEASMGYLRLQSRIGATQNRSTAELAESTRKYLIEQDALTKLTGMTRKEQEDARDAIRSQEVFAGKLLQLRNRGADQAAKQLEDTFLVLQKDSKEVGQGFADISSGNLRTEAAQKLMRATQGEAMRVQQELSAGQITAAQAADRISQALGRNVDMYGETQGVLGNYNSTYGDLAGQITIASRQLTGGYEKQLAAIDKNSKQMGITGDKALDAEIQRQTDLRLNQQKAMQNMQDFVRMGVTPATEATAFFGKVIERVTNLLPGSGKFAKEYEQQKKDREEIIAKEKTIAERTQAVMDAKAKVDSARDAKEKAAAEEELKAATIKMKSAVVERDNLNEAISKRKMAQAGPVKETTQAEKEAAAKTEKLRAAAEPIKQRVDVLQQQLAEDEKALKDAKRAGKYGDELKPLEEKIRKNKEEYEKATKELIDSENAIKQSAGQEQQIRLKQMQDRKRLARLEAENLRDAEEIAKFNELKADLHKQIQGATDPLIKKGAEKALGLLEQNIASRKTAIESRSPEIGNLKGQLKTTAVSTRSDVAAGGAQSSGPIPASGPRSGGGSDGNVSSPEQAGGIPSGAAQAKGAKEGEIARVVDSRPGQITVQTTDGDMQRRVGNANWRMNNPGNLRLTDWVKKQGGVVGEGDAGPSGKFAVFSSLEAGRQAKENLLFSGNTVYANLNLREAMYKYAPVSDNNPTETYLQNILKATGTSDSTKLAEMNQSQRHAMLAEIERFEGFKPGTIYAAADGGIVREKLGGTLIQAGEAGQDEAVVPLKNGNIPVTFNGVENFAETLQKITDEFKSALNQMVRDMQQNRSSDLSEQTLEVLRSIEQAAKSSSDTQDKLLRVAQN